MTLLTPFAGVRPAEVMLSHVVTQFLVLTVQVGLLLLCTFTIFQVPSSVFVCSPGIVFRICVFTGYRPLYLCVHQVPSSVYVCSPCIVSLSVCTSGTVSVSVCTSGTVLCICLLYLYIQQVPKTLRFLILFFWSHLCLIGPFNYISLYESLLQPWYNP